jgi:hypothetical protein
MSRYCLSALKRLALPCDGFSLFSVFISPAVHKLNKCLAVSKTMGDLGVLRFQVANCFGVATVCWT